MSNSRVVIRDDAEFRVPTPDSITLTPGGSVTFEAQDADSALYFSPSTAAILSPTPRAPLDLKSGKSATFTFAHTISPGSYGLITQAPGDSAPQTFDFGAASTPPVLVIQPGSGGGDFPVPDNGTGT